MISGLNAIGFDTSFNTIEKIAKINHYVKEKTSKEKDG